jgi:hypothetical protein
MTSLPLAENFSKRYRATSMPLQYRRKRDFNMLIYKTIQKDAQQRDEVGFAQRV